MKNKIELRTKSLILRQAESTDSRAIFRYRSDAKTNRYQGWIPKSLDDAETFIRKTSSEIDIPGSWFQFVIIKFESSEIVGDLGVHFKDKDQVEIGCTLAKEAQGCGLATDALRSVINYLFESLNKHRIIGSVDPRNSKSIALLERLGFRKEAHFKKSIFAGGEWLDDVVYALLKNEWGKNSSQ